MCKETFILSVYYNSQSNSTWHNSSATIRVKCSILHLSCPNTISTILRSHSSSLTWVTEPILIKPLIWTTFIFARKSILWRKSSVLTTPTSSIYLSNLVLETNLRITKLSTISPLIYWTSLTFIFPFLPFPHFYFKISTINFKIGFNLRNRLWQRLKLGLIVDCGLIWYSISCLFWDTWFCICGLNEQVWTPNTCSINS